MNECYPDSAILLSPQGLLQAYALGFFPMAENATSDRVFWCDPPKRGVIPIHRFHIPRRLKATICQFPYEITVNKAFDRVIEGCADRKETWINKSIKDSYIELFKNNHAHSLECWEDDNLVAGVYGVSLGAAFFAESMFTRKTNASKIALVHLVSRLWAGDYQLLDTQFLNAHIEQFGAIEISRDFYREQLSQAIKQKNQGLLDFSSSSALSVMAGKAGFFSSEEELISAFLQSRTQIS